MELLTSFCLCFLKKPVRQDGVYGAVTSKPSTTATGEKPGFFRRKNKRPNTVGAFVVALA
ncbi:hypothetical protein QT370_22490 [Xanthomonas citri pv. citri]